MKGERSGAGLEGRGQEVLRAEWTAPAVNLPAAHQDALSQRHAGNHPGQGRGPAPLRVPKNGGQRLHTSRNCQLNKP